MTGKAVGWWGWRRGCAGWWPASSRARSTVRRRCGRWSCSARWSGWRRRARPWPPGGWRRPGSGSAGGCARRPIWWPPPVVRRSARRWRRWRRPGVWTSCRPPPRRCVRGSCRRPRRVRSSPPPGIGPTSRRRWWRPPGRSRCRRCRSGAGRCGPRARPRWTAYQRIRAGRYLRHWTDGEGALCLQARLCPDDGAKVLAAIEAYRPRIFATARARRAAGAVPGLRGRRPGGAGRRRGRRRTAKRGRGPWSTCGSTTPHWCGATPKRARPATSPAWGRSRWPPPGPWPPTASSRCW